MSPLTLDQESPPLVERGICVDCDATKLIDRYGACTQCGSKSVIKKGAIAELKKAIRAKDKYERRLRKAKGPDVSSLEAHPSSPNGEIKAKDEVDPSASRPSIGAE